MKKILFLVFFSVIALFGTINAQKLSVAYLDMAYILKNLPQYESANDQINMLSKKWQKEVDAAQEQARVMSANYQSEQIFLSEQMREQREQEILNKEKEALELRHKYFGPEGELFKKREALLKPIQDEIFATIQEIASEKRYDIVKDRSTDKSLIYMSNKLDISDLVLQKLGAK
ncbi:MAG: OmpH family outer membrane protein [Paludibacteraceae bacterium]|nr:OmpH family outer membrane protein [Paludibacteraceae bacterium]MBR1786980.1 OmpH family outer membrane protein [Paludibacteraceae bacterium]